MPVTEIYILVPHLLRCVLWFAEIIPNTIHTHLSSHPQTYVLHDRDRIFFDCSTPASRLRRSASSELLMAYLAWLTRAWPGGGGGVWRPPPEYSR